MIYLYLLGGKTPDKLPWVTRHTVIRPTVLPLWQGPKADRLQLPVWRYGRFPKVSYCVLHYSDRHNKNIFAFFIYLSPLLIHLDWYIFATVYFSLKSTTFISFLLFFLFSTYSRSWIVRKVTYPLRSLLSLGSRRNTNKRRRYLPTNLRLCLTSSVAVNPAFSMWTPSDRSAMDVTIREIKIQVNVLFSSLCLSDACFCCADWRHRPSLWKMVYS